MTKKVKRLYEGFQPKNYHLTLTPDREAMRLTGTVVITGQKVGRPSQRLTFHQHNLKITAATIVRHDKRGDQTMEVIRLSHHKSFDEIRLHTQGQLFAGSYTVTMEFNGPITRNMEGVYPCAFTHDGQEKKLIATQFESHHAREAFPGIDEPEAKATFDLTLISPVGETAIANTPIAHQEEKDGKLVTIFQTTPKMSTYLLAFAYGDIGFKEATTKSGVLIRTYATPDNVAFTEFALEVAVKTLEFFNDYFDIPYPLDKCDMIALPDFASGAMENWGMITFREQCMLVDPANTSLPNRQYVAMVVAHELAHQWFGNLVTMRWWTDLWLNEGFASWIEYLATDYNFPEWQMWTQFIVDEQHIALKLDALENTHPIEVAIHHPDEIRSIFDAISYSKGSSVIHMLEQYLGHDVFRDGLRHYLKQHAYGNTDTIDLWQALETVSEKPVKQFMAAWTSQAGFPIVQATITGEHFALRQEVFQMNREAVPETAKKLIWPITLQSGDRTHVMFDTRELEGTITGTDSASFKLNHDQGGLYRVAYNPEHLARLSELVRADKLQPLDRLGLLSDTFEAAKAGYTDTVSALHFMEAFTHEASSPVWDVMSGNLSSIRAAMADDELRESLKPYIRKLVAEQLKRLGWEAKPNEPHFDSLLRPTVIGLAAGADEPVVLEEIEKRFSAMKKSEDLDPDLRGIIYTTVARRGNEATFERLLQLHNDSTSPEERVTLAAALTNFKQEGISKHALALIATDTVRLQDVGYWVAYSFMNRFARDLTWQWMIDNWAWLKQNLGADLSFYRLPVYAARVYSTLEFLPQYQAFFTSVMEPALERSYKQGVEMIQWQAAWRDRDLKALQDFFRS